MTVPIGFYPELQISASRDSGDGLFIDGVKTTLFVAWFVWSRLRVIRRPGQDDSSVMEVLDVTLRRLGGAPAYFPDR